MADVSDGVHAPRSDGFCLTDAERRVLLAIRREHRRSYQDIADDADVSAATVARSVRVLAAMRLVRHTPFSKFGVEPTTRRTM